MDVNELKQIVSRGEDSYHQFKEDIRNVDSLAAEMVAFSNSRGGSIFIGVSNQSQLIGLSGKDVEKLRRIFQSIDLIHADEIPTRADVDALDKRRFFDFFQSVYNEPQPESPAEILKLLENMNLANNGHLNLAGLLLFGEKPQLYKPEFVVKAVTFAGNNITDTYLDSEDFGGPLPIIFQGALAFIMRNLRKIQKQKSVNTVGEPEIPQIVFEELLVNALIHRDYFVSAPIRLFVFENRIEIINPGSLPNHLTIEKIRAGNSVQRNPILASFVAKGLLPYRGLGTGVRRALRDWPQIRFHDDRDGCLFTSLVERQVLS